MISIIIPVYNEEKSLPALQDGIVKAVLNFGDDYEIIYIDDGSKDSTFDILCGFAQVYSKTKIIQFSKHFGQTEAMQAGIDYSQGEILVFLDADLQNDPKDIVKLVNKINEGFDVVCGWRKNREDGFWSRVLPSRIANYFISSLSKLRLHDYGCTLKAFRKQTIKEIRLYSEMHRFMPIFALRKGARIAEVEVIHYKRISGESKYNLFRSFKVILDLFVAVFLSRYLVKPMYVFGAGGLFCFFVSFLLGIFIVVRKIFFNGIWISPLIFVMLILIVISFQFFLMGFLAEIFIRLYFETKNEVTYSVRSVKNA